MGSVRIICLHRVVPENERERYWPWLLRGSAITDRDLREGLTALARSHDWVDEEAAWEIIRDERPRSRPACWLTFDDGYHDNLSAAAPIVRAFGIRPTLFVSTRVLQPDFLLPVDRWYLSILGARRSTVRMNLGHGEWHVDLFDRDARLRLVSGPEKQRYVQSSPEQRAAIVDQLQDVLDTPASPASLQERARYVTERDLEELSSLGWRIGHHGASHCLLTGLNGDELLAEVVGPARTLSRMSNATSRFMAWPDGAWTPGAASQVADVLGPFGYVGGLTIEARDATCLDDPWAVPRWLLL